MGDLLCPNASTAEAERNVKLSDCSNETEASDISATQ